MSGGQWLEDLILEAHGAGSGGRSVAVETKGVDLGYSEISDQSLDEQLARLTAEKARRSEAKRLAREEEERKERARDDADIRRLQVRGFRVERTEEAPPLPPSSPFPYDDGCRCHGRCVCEEASK